jgi:hypothetical protein
MFTVSVNDIDSVLNLITVSDSDLTKQLPPEFSEFWDVFSLKEAERLPPY